MLTKAQVVTMMNHINNTARASLNGRTPFELASLLLPDTLLRWSGAAAIPHDEVLLKAKAVKDVPALMLSIRKKLPAFE